MKLPRWLLLCSILTALALLPGLPALDAQFGARPGCMCGPRSMQSMTVTRQWNMTMGYQQAQMQNNYMQQMRLNAQSQQIRLQMNMPKVQKQTVRVGMTQNTSKTLNFARNGQSTITKTTANTITARSRQVITTNHAMTIGTRGGPGIIGRHPLTIISSHTRVIEGMSQKTKISSATKTISQTAYGQRTIQGSRNVIGPSTSLTKVTGGTSKIQTTEAKINTQLTKVNAGTKQIAGSNTMTITSMQKTCCSGSGTCTCNPCMCGTGSKMPDPIAARQPNPLPQMVTQPRTQPQMVTQPRTLPQMVQNQPKPNLPQMLGKPAQPKLPQMLAQQAQTNLPQMLGKPGQPRLQEPLGRTGKPQQPTMIAKTQQLPTGLRTDKPAVTKMLAITSRPGVLVTPLWNVPTSPVMPGGPMPPPSLPTGIASTGGLPGMPSSGPMQSMGYDPSAPSHGMTASTQSLAEGITTPAVPSLPVEALQIPMPPQTHEMIHQASPLAKLHRALNETPADNAPQELATSQPTVPQLSDADLQVPSMPSLPGSVLVLAGDADDAQDEAVPQLGQGDTTQLVQLVPSAPSVGREQAAPARTTQRQGVPASGGASRQSLTMPSMPGAGSGAL